MAVRGNTAIADAEPDLLIVSATPTVDLTPCACGCGIPVDLAVGVQIGGSWYRPVCSIDDDGLVVGGTYERCASCRRTVTSWHGVQVGDSWFHEKCKPVAAAVPPWEAPGFKLEPDTETLADVIDITHRAPTVRPYADTAMAYRAAGWTGVLPLPARQKKTPPTGYTGWHAQVPSGADIQTWADSFPDGNIALHLPEGVVGVDVDQYGAKRGAATLAGLVAAHGELPPTWTSTSRLDGSGSGIRLFRVPEGLEWPGVAGYDIEMIHSGHRYAVVWPSIHPDTGQTYAWLAPDGSVSDRPPRVDELPDMPAAWVHGLTGGCPRGDKAASTGAEWGEYAASCRAADSSCTVAADILARISQAVLGGSRHDTVRDLVMALVAAGAEGHAGIPAAIKAGENVYCATVGSDRRGAYGEYWRMVHGAVDKVGCRPAVDELVLDSTAPPVCGCGVIGVPFVGGDGRKVDVGPDPEPKPDVDVVRAELNELGDDKDARKSASRAVASRLIPAGVAAAEIDEWRDLLTGAGGLTAKGFDAIIAEGKRAAKSLAKAQPRERRPQPGEVILPSPHNPMALARSMVDERPSTDGVVHDARWRGDFYTWADTHWVVEEDTAVRQRVYLYTEHALYEDPRYGLVDWNPDRHSVASVLDALGSGVLRRPGDVDADRAIACQNGVVTPAGELLPHTPARFNVTAALPYAYDPDATCPQWLAFLDEIMPAEDAQRFLQEWFGYVISGGTQLQKMASLVGPPRCGKGTVARVLTALLGAGSVAAPTLGKLGTQFGEQGLIGKSLAVFGDVRWNDRAIAEAVPVLLGITGEDSRDVPRKGREDWSGRLGVRIMMMSNDEPSFNEASGALANRMIHVVITKSFLGVEDTGLTDRLLTELPGVLNWALAGLRRLRAKGEFNVPACSREVTASVQRTSSPERAFVEDVCELVETASVSLDDLYRRYGRWCRDDAGRDTVATKEIFSRNLRSAFRGHVEVKRRRSGGRQVQVVEGLRVSASCTCPNGQHGVHAGDCLPS